MAGRMKASYVQNRSVVRVEDAEGRYHYLTRSQVAGLVVSLERALQKMAEAEGTPEPGESLVPDDSFTEVGLSVTKNIRS